MCSIQPSSIRLPKWRCQVPHATVLEIRSPSAERSAPGRHDGGCDHRGNPLLPSASSTAIDRNTPLRIKEAITSAFGPQRSLRPMTSHSEVPKMHVAPFGSEVFPAIWFGSLPSASRRLKCCANWTGKALQKNDRLPTKRIKRTTGHTQKVLHPEPNHRSTSIFSPLGGNFRVWHSPLGWRAYPLRPPNLLPLTPTRNHRPSKRARLAPPPRCGARPATPAARRGSACSGSSPRRSGASDSVWGRVGGGGRGLIAYRGVLIRHIIPKHSMYVVFSWKKMPCRAGVPKVETF